SYLFRDPAHLMSDALSGKTNFHAQVVLNFFRLIGSNNPGFVDVFNKGVLYVDFKGSQQPQWGEWYGGEFNRAPNVRGVLPLSFLR
ncbi:MAG: hypothetical protein K2X47_09360, partial [Bdellovibrionales bacterium]|nr:hypothetical protein [Bdellovibrionales bacterium]